MSSCPAVLKAYLMLSYEGCVFLPLILAIQLSFALSYHFEKLKVGSLSSSYNYSDRHFLINHFENRFQLYEVCLSFFVLIHRVVIYIYSDGHVLSYHFLKSRFLL